MNPLSPKSVSAILILALLVFGSAIATVPVVHASAPSKSSVQDAISQAENYLSNLMRTMYENGVLKYKVVSEYPDVPVWAKYDNYVWVPAVDRYYTINCGGGLPVGVTTSVEVSLISQNAYSDRTVWVFQYDFYLQWSGSGGGDEVKLATVKVTETQHYYGVFDVVAEATSYSLAYDPEHCIDINGKDLRINIADVFVGTVGELLNTPSYTLSYAKPVPSFRFSMRHVLVLSDLYYQSFHSTDSKLQNLDTKLFDVIFPSGNLPFDLYGVALWEYCPYMTTKDVSEIQFYDAHWFNAYPSLGYDRMFQWFENHGYIDGINTRDGYPLYPYKSKVVSAAEITGLNGGTLFLEALSRTDDALLYAWQGYYDAVQGDWSSALNKFWKAYQYWDGNGITTTYSNHYSGVRLAAVALLGTILAKHGYLSWSYVDPMINKLLEIQWNGEGYYYDGSQWIYIYKWDHKGGFMVSYDTAPDGSYGLTGFRPDYLQVITQGADMPSEYPGVLPTNAETTLVALLALQMYLQARY